MTSMPPVGETPPEPTKITFQSVMRGVKNLFSKIGMGKGENESLKTSVDKIRKDILALSNNPKETSQSINSEILEKLKHVENRVKDTNTKLQNASFMKFVTNRRDLQAIQTFDDINTKYATVLGALAKPSVISNETATKCLKEISKDKGAYLICIPPMNSLSNIQVSVKPPGSNEIVDLQFRIKDNKFERLFNFFPSNTKNIPMPENEMSKEKLVDWLMKLGTPVNEKADEIDQEVKASYLKNIKEALGPLQEEGKKLPFYEKWIPPESEEFLNTPGNNSYIFCPHKGSFTENGKESNKFALATSKAFSAGVAVGFYSTSVTFTKDDDDKFRYTYKDIKGNVQTEKTAEELKNYLEEELHLTPGSLR